MAKTAYTNCVGKKLRGKMKNKTKAQRKKIFKQAAHACSIKARKK